MRLVFLAGLMLAAAPLRAEPAVETFISCPVGGGRHLEVLIRHGDFAGEGSFSYSFGPPGRPDLSLSVPMSAGSVTPWSGVGRAIWSSVRFFNADYEYEAWNSFDRLEQEAGLQAGVSVLRNGTLLAHFECQGGEIAPVFTLEDAMAAAGYCWNTEDFGWRRSDCG
ncbi:hypothetical protein [Pseudogemmobacter sonorensis]|uniref:hypothetical protein n=1 Tax=Pseudogemmobacter sonorensis TaxID=2989681 RepID=UPI00369E4745